MEKIDLSVFLKKFHCPNLPTGGVFLTNPLAAYLKKKNKRCLLARHDYTSFEEAHRHMKAIGLTRRVPQQVVFPLRARGSMLYLPITTGALAKANNPHLSRGLISEALPTKRHIANNYQVEPGQLSKKNTPLSWNMEDKHELERADQNTELEHGLKRRENS